MDKKKKNKSRHAGMKSDEAGILALISSYIRQTD